jgi:hypothetical protein
VPNITELGAPGKIIGLVWQQASLVPISTNRAAGNATQKPQDSKKNKKKKKKAN